MPAVLSETVALTASVVCLSFSCLARSRSRFSLCTRQAPKEQKASKDTAARLHDPPKLKPGRPGSWPRCTCGDGGAQECERGLPLAPSPLPHALHASAAAAAAAAGATAATAPAQPTCRKRRRPCQSRPCPCSSLRWCQTHLHPLHGRGRGGLQGEG